MRYLVPRDSSAIKSNIISLRITFILVLFHWLKPLTEEEGEETGLGISLSVILVESRHTSSANGSADKAKMNAI